MTRIVFNAAVLRRVCTDTVIRTQKIPIVYVYDNYLDL